ncbi:MAG: hypothetical protein AABN33_16980 [Acidobacteriota bacterium]
MKQKTQNGKSWKALRQALTRRTSISQAEISALVKKHADVAVDHAIGGYARWRSEAII